MNVFSAFGGLEVGLLALKELGIPVENYYSSEINKWALAISRYNFPDIINLGDIQEVKPDLQIDLLLGGSPCQQISKAGNQAGVIVNSLEEYLELKNKDYDFGTNQSVLFWEYIRLLRELKPKYFLLENVKMSKENLEIFNNELGVKGVNINSSLVSGQNRPRIYWSNFPITQPVDKGVLLRDVILDDAEPIMFSNIYGGFKESTPRVHEDKSVTIRTAKGGGHIPSLLLSEKAKVYMSRLRSGSLHSKLTANMFKGVPYGVIKELMRRIHPIEAERLQTFSDDWTRYGLIGTDVVEISATQRYSVIGNSWTKDVIKHILGEMWKQEIG